MPASNLERLQAGMKIVLEAAEAIEREAAQHTKNARDLGMRLDDALDEVHALRTQNASLTQLNEELRTIHSSAPASKRAVVSR